MTSSLNACRVINLTAGARYHHTVPLTSAFSPLFSPWNVQLCLSNVTDTAGSLCTPLWAWYKYVHSDDCREHCLYIPGSCHIQYLWGTSCTWEGIPITQGLACFVIAWVNKQMRFIVYLDWARWAASSWSLCMYICTVRNVCFAIYMWFCRSLWRDGMFVVEMRRNVPWWLHAPTEVYCISINKSTPFFVTERAKSNAQSPFLTKWNLPKFLANLLLERRRYLVVLHKNM